MACRNFPLTSWRGSRCGKTTTAHQFVLANATPDVPRSISRSLARLAVSTLWHFRGSATGALWRRIGIIINRKPPRLAGTSAWVRRGAADSGTLRAPRWRPRERLTSAGKNYLAEIRRRLEHRDPGRVASLILFSLSLIARARSSRIGKRLQLGSKAELEGTSPTARLPRTSRKNLMYHHVKKLMYTVRVDEPDPRFGNMLLEQFGGANGELAAAMQYSVQGLNCEDAARKDLLMDIGTEELSHLEIVGTLARMHLKPLKSVREAAEADPLIAIAGGGGVNFSIPRAMPGPRTISRSPANLMWTCAATSQPKPAPRSFTNG